MKVRIEDLKPEEATKIHALLLTYFPWLKTEESVSGADVIDQLINVAILIDLQK